MLSVVLVKLWGGIAMSRVSLMWILLVQGLRKEVRPLLRMMVLNELMLDGLCAPPCYSFGLYNYLPTDTPGCFKTKFETIWLKSTD